MTGLEWRGTSRAMSLAHRSIAAVAFVIPRGQKWSINIHAPSPALGISKARFIFMSAATNLLITSLASKCCLVVVGSGPGAKIAVPYNDDDVSGPGAVALGKKVTSVRNSIVGCL